MNFPVIYMAMKVGKKAREMWYFTKKPLNYGFRADY